jgi:hypothetical protein
MIQLVLSGTVTVSMASTFLNLPAGRFSAVSGVTVTATSLYGPIIAMVRCRKSSIRLWSHVTCGPSGGVDTNSVPTVANAWAAGMTHVDVYLFPCYTCGNPEGQVNETGQN